jgi:hypothetical protein
MFRAVAARLAGARRAKMQREKKKLRSEGEMGAKEAGWGEMLQKKGRGMRFYHLRRLSATAAMNTAATTRR